MFSKKKCKKKDCQKCNNKTESNDSLVSLSSLSVSSFESRSNSVDSVSENYEYYNLKIINDEKLDENSKSKFFIKKQDIPLRREREKRYNLSKSPQISDLLKIIDGNKISPINYKNDYFIGNINECSHE